MEEHGLKIAIAVFAIIGVIIFVMGNRGTVMVTRVGPTPATATASTEPVAKRKLFNMKGKRDYVLPILGLIIGSTFAWWCWDEFGVKTTAYFSHEKIYDWEKANEYTPPPMYPYTFRVTQYADSNEIMRPPTEGFAIWACLEDNKGKVNFKVADLWVIGYANGQELAPMKYDPPNGLMPDLNALQFFRFVVNGKKGNPKSVKVTLKMDTSRIYSPSVAMSSIPI